MAYFTKITEAGKGDAIKATDTVKVHYTGKLPDGKVFDSSVERGQPVEFKLNQVIKGWTEGLQLVKKGGKIELVIPPELAYGKQGAGDSIPPDATLYFDVEVLDVNLKIVLNSNRTLSKGAVIFLPDLKNDTNR